MAFLRSVRPALDDGAATRMHVDSGDDGGEGKSDVEAPTKAPPHATPRRSALANAALYGTINGIVAVPAMVSFVAIIFQVGAIDMHVIVPMRLRDAFQACP